MKATGVVRRIDELGRIVIPKEIRKTLRIRDGESLEIYVDDEAITLKKYSSMKDLTDVSNNLVNTISQSIDKSVIICDRDKIISASSNVKNKYVGKSISKFVEQTLVDRNVIIEKSLSKVEIIDGNKDNIAYVVVPIISNGDVTGGIIVLTEHGSVGELEEKIALITAQFIGKHIEE